MASQTSLTLRNAESRRRADAARQRIADSGFALPEPQRATRFEDVNQAQQLEDFAAVLEAVADKLAPQEQSQEEQPQDEPAKTEPVGAPTEATIELQEERNAEPQEPQAQSDADLLPSVARVSGQDAVTALMGAFGSEEAILAASDDELLKVKGVGKRTVEVISEFR